MLVLHVPNLREVDGSVCLETKIPCNTARDASSPAIELEKACSESYVAKRLDLGHFGHYNNDTHTYI